MMASITSSTVTSSNVCLCITLTKGPTGRQIAGSVGPKIATVGIPKHCCQVCDTRIVAKIAPALL